jgi:hypothetical protein
MAWRVVVSVGLHLVAAVIRLLRPQFRAGPASALAFGLMPGHISLRPEFSFVHPGSKVASTSTEKEEAKFKHSLTTT